MTPLTRERARELLESFTGRRLVVAGDVMLDEYVFGYVQRISPEAPVPVVRVRRQAHRLGGAGNVAANAALLGAAVRLVGVVGGDEAGRRLAAEAQARGIGSMELVADPGRSTTVKTR